MVGRGEGWFDFGVGFGAGHLLVRVGTGGFSVRTFGFGIIQMSQPKDTSAAHTPALVALIFHHDTVAEHPDMNISAQTSLPTSWASR